MKPPLHVESVLYESGRSWNLIDSVGVRVAAYMDKATADLIAHLVNTDYRRYRNTPDLSDTNEVETQCVDEE